MKHINRFFLSQKLVSGENTALDQEDMFHAVKVLRLREGDPVEVADAGGDVFSARIVSINGAVRVTTGEMIAGGGGGAERLIVAQALPRGRKMDLVVEKLSELGADMLVPVQTARSVRGPKGDSEKMRRWRRIARAAAAQARRGTVMDIAAPHTLDGWLDAVGDGSLVALSTGDDAGPLGAVLEGMAPPVNLLVGPESGFDPAELEQLAARGARLGRLGDTVLRTETAALVAAAIVLHTMGELG